MSFQSKNKLTRREALQLLSAGAGAWFLAACSARVENNASASEPLQHNQLNPSATQALTPTSLPELQSLIELPPGFDAARLTAIEDFYTQTYDSVAKPDPLTWALSLVGLVDNPLTLSLIDIKTRPSVERMHTLECIGNPVGGNLIGNTNWVGLSFRELLLEAGVQEDGKYLHFFCADDYFTSVPIELGLDERSMLVYRMGGEDLPAAHGSPLRALFPGVYGQKQPKWINSIRVDRSNKDGTWENKGWSNEATIQINSKIETPRLQQYIPADTPFYLTGWAMADPSGVRSVEISVDDGQTWQEATLLPGPHTSVWTLWYWVWEDPTPGTHVLIARATDGNGNSQTGGGVAGVLDNVFPNGSSMMHRVPINVVRQS
jgi:DMSO/TMAO reductase YedYZ molybdopterin-dependent catalytic subunit